MPVRQRIFVDSSATLSLSLKQENRVTAACTTQGSHVQTKRSTWDHNLTCNSYEGGGRRHDCPSKTCATLTNQIVEKVPSSSQIAKSNIFAIHSNTCWILEEFRNSRTVQRLRVRLVNLACPTQVSELANSLELEQTSSVNVIAKALEENLHGLDIFHVNKDLIWHDMGPYIVTDLRVMACKERLYRWILFFSSEPEKKLKRHNY